jgi:hypothetical protein
MVNLYIFNKINVDQVFCEKILKYNFESTTLSEFNLLLRILGL